MAPCDIEFTYRQPHNVPCSWMSTEYRYVVCLRCVEGTEIRYCDGTTDYQYTTCTEHQHELNTGVTYDRDFLDWVRESLKDGTLKRPRVQSPLKPAITLNRSAVQIQRGKEIEEIKAWWPESAKGKDWPMYELKPEELDVLQRQPSQTPWPEDLSLEYSHADNCNYGIHPSYVLAPKSVIATFNEKILEDREKLYWYGCEFCIREMLPEAQEDTVVVKRDPTIHRPLERAHCSECVVIMNRAIVEACYVPDVLKMVFFKRCNQEYINALGYRIEFKSQDTSGTQKYHPPNTEFTYTALKNREEMVVVGSIDDENFVRFAWSKNLEYARKKAAAERDRLEQWHRQEIERKKKEFKAKVKERAEAILNATEQDLGQLGFEVDFGQTMIATKNRRDSGVGLDR